MSDWEAELRRLLDGASPDSPTSAPPVIAVDPQPQPPPPRSEPTTAPAPLPALAPRRSSRPLYSEAMEEAPEPARRLAVLQQSADAHTKVGRFHEEVAGKVRHADRIAGKRSVPMIGAEARTESSEAYEAHRWLSQRVGLRQAIMASVILGPPRSTEP